MTATPTLLPVAATTATTGLTAASGVALEDGEASFTGLLNQLFTAETSLTSEVDILAQVEVSELPLTNEIPVESGLTEELLVFPHGQGLAVEGAELVLEGQELPLISEVLPSVVTVEENIVGNLGHENRIPLEALPEEAIAAVVPIAAEITKAVIESKERNIRIGDKGANAGRPLAASLSESSGNPGRTAAMNSQIETNPLFALKEISESGLGADRVKMLVTEGKTPLVSSADSTGINPNIAQVVNKMPQMATATLSVDRPVGQPGWAEDIGSQIKWMANGKIQGAEMRLNPQHLGPMEVRVTVQNDQTSVTFISQHAAVREALDAALPRLRELLADSGIQLTQANVGEHGSSQQARHNENKDHALAQDTEQVADGTVAHDDDDSEALQNLPSQSGLGLVDTFA